MELLLPCAQGLPHGFLVLLKIGLLLLFATVICFHIYVLLAACARVLSRLFDLVQKHQLVNGCIKTEPQVPIFSAGISDRMEEKVQSVPEMDEILYERVFFQRALLCQQSRKKWEVLA